MPARKRASREPPAQSDPIEELTRVVGEQEPHLGEQEPHRDRRAPDAPTLAPT